MDCRIAVVLGLGLLTGAAGCTPSATTSLSRDTEPVQVEPTAAQKRQTQTRVLVAAGDYCLHDAEIAEKPEAEKVQLVEKARRSYRQALKLEPSCLAAQCGLARACLIEHQPARAIEAYHVCLKDHPKDAVLWFELGMAHGRLGQWRPAVEALGKAVELDVDNRRFTNMLGFALAETGDYEDSLACFRRTVGEARAHFALAKLLLRTNKQDLCRQQLHLALRADPTFQDASVMLVKLDGGSPPTNPVAPAKYQQQQR